MTVARLVPTFLGLVGVAHRGLRCQPTALLGKGFLAALFPAAGDRALGVGLPGVVPVAERIAVPWWLWRQHRQFQLVPDLAGAVHELAGGQSEWRKRLLQRGVDQQR